MNLLITILLVLVAILYLRLLFPIIVTFKKIDPEAIKPTRAYHRAACWDVYSIEDGVIPAGQWREIRTGIIYATWPHIHIPFLNLTFTPLSNVVMKIYTRSGLAKKKAWRNHLGIIDNDYRGELTILAYNHRSDYPIRFRKGDKIAQIEFTRVPGSHMFEVRKLSDSLRGDKGFGSSGV
jgi:dUTP pyrophosphatase